MALQKSSPSSFLLPLCLLLVLQLLLWLTKTSAQSYARSGCQEYCGDVRIPYPFGIGLNCYLDEWFSIGCKNSSINNNGVAPYLIKIDVEVLEISLNGNYLRVNNPVTSPNCPINNNSSNHRDPNNASWDSSIDLRSSPFRFSEINNVFMATGLNCNDPGLKLCDLTRKKIQNCSTTCDSANNITCTVGISNVQYLQGYWVGFVNEALTGSMPCKYGFVVDMNKSTVDYSSGVQTHVPAVLNWVVNNITQLQLVPDNNKNSYSCLQGSLAYSSIPTTSGLLYDGLSLDTCVVVQSLQCACNFPFSGNPYFSNGCLGTSYALSTHLSNQPTN
ncbi:hypothetical protein CsSME_00011429 [Camellia sinensis var. sinensis]